MTFNREREELDNLLVLFNNQSFSMSKNGCNNILPLKFSPDEIRRAIDLNFTMRINFSNKRDLSLCNRKIKMTIRVDVFIKVKSFWQMPERSPETVFKYPGESCAMFFLCKSPVRFLIVVIMQKTFTGSSKDSKCRTIMSPEHPFLPEGIKTLNRCISTRLSPWDKYQMYFHEQVKTDKLGDTVRVASSTCGRHLVIHLRYPGNSHKSPCFNQMSTQRDSLFIRKLTCEGCMPCNIHSMKRIKSSESFWTSEISWSNKVCLMEVSNLFGSNIWIRLIISISFWRAFSNSSISGKNPINSGDRWHIANLSLLKLPVNNLCSNAREGRATTLMRFQLLSDRENLFNHTIRGFSPDSFRSTAFVLETFKSMLFIPFEPFEKPSSTPLNHLEYFVETVSFFMKLYCFTTFFIFLLILHRLYLLQKFFGKSLGDVNFSLRCYDIFKVYDVMI